MHASPAEYCQVHYSLIKIYLHMVMVAVEDKSLQHQPTMNVLEIMFSAWVHVEITCCGPILKIYEPRLKQQKFFVHLSQKAITFEKNDAQYVITMQIQKDNVISENFHVGLMN